MRKLLQERLSEAMRSRGLEPEQLADRSGVPLRKITRWLEDGTIPSQVQVQKLGWALGVSVPYLMDWDSMYPYKEDEEAAVTFQIIGEIGLTESGHIEEQFTDAYETIPQPWLLDGTPNEFCVVRAPGEALVPAIMPQDLLFCRKAPVVPDGSVAVVLNGASPAGLRTVRYGNEGERIVLGGLDPDMEDTVVEGEALAECHVIAHVLRVIRVLQ